MITIDQVTSTIQNKAGNIPNMGATMKLALDIGTVYVDATSDEASVTNEDKDADCTITTTAETLDKLRTGKLNPMMAVMTGKVKIKGDMGVAMKLQSLLS